MIGQHVSAPSEFELKVHAPTDESFNYSVFEEPESSVGNKPTSFYQLVDKEDPLAKVNFMK